MATINGITVKALKTFKGCEGTACQGNLYLNNKKIGFWTQDGNGAPDSIYLDSAYSELKLENALKKAQNKENDGFMFMELFMQDVVTICESEKAYKKNAKNGYPVVIEVTDGYHVSYLGCNKAYASMNDEELLARTSRQIESIKSNMFKNEEKQIKVYRSLDDFIIGEPISLSDIIHD